jgi:toxin HigB-1
MLDRALWYEASSCADGVGVSIAGVTLASAQPWERRMAGAPRRGNSVMIVSFRSKALRQFWEEGNRRGLRPDLVERINILLFALDAAKELDDLVGIADFHSLRGKPQRYALSVNKNWRITFGWADEAATALDLEDYH